MNRTDKKYVSKKIDEHHQETLKNLDTYLYNSSDLVKTVYQNEAKIGSAHNRIGDFYVNTSIIVAIILGAVAYISLTKVKEVKDAAKKAKEDYDNAMADSDAARNKANETQKEAEEMFKKASEALKKVEETQQYAEKRVTEIEEIRDSIGEAESLEKESQAHFDQAMIYQKQGEADSAIYNYEKAIYNYEKLIAGNPKHKSPLYHASMYNNLGSVYFKKKDYNLAIKNYKEANKIDPSFAQPLYNIGTTHHLKKEYDRAIHYFEKAININPDYAEAYNNLGSVYSDTKNYNTAIEYYKGATRANPNLAEPLYNIGNIYTRKKEYDLAIEYCKKAVSIAPKNAGAQSSIGAFYLAKNEYDLALKHYQEARRLNQNKNKRDANVYNSLAWVLLVNKHINNAKENLEIAEEMYTQEKLGTPYQFYINTGNILLVEGNKTNTKDQYQKAIALDKEEAIKEIREDLEKLKEVYPNKKKDFDSIEQWLNESYPDENGEEERK
ncbi:MAG: tetratricopeptide repeat protein [Alphaproteobacteria bacterium]